jgi:hypothetical protein
MAHWPALRRWRDPEYLRRVAGCRTVPVEVGAHYLHGAWTQELMTLVGGGVWLHCRGGVWLHSRGGCRTRRTCTGLYIGPQPRLSAVINNLNVFLCFQCKGMRKVL